MVYTSDRSLLVVADSGKEKKIENSCRNCIIERYEVLCLLASGYSEKSVWLVFQIWHLRLQVIDKSYRQVLTPVNSSQLLLKLEILDRLRLVTFHKTQHIETATL